VTGAPLSLLVKPAGAACNLACSYCFYLGNSAAGGLPAAPRMPEAVLERLLARFLAVPQARHSVCWQGGEPALLGAGFFRTVVRLEAELGRPGQVVANSLQTNGTLIDEPLAALLAEYRFHVGLSLDGPADLHDRHRRGADGSASHARALTGLALLRRHGVEPTALVMVTAESAGRAREIYRCLRDLGLRSHHYIPCVEFDAAGSPRPGTISGERWGRFLNDLAAIWLEDGAAISIRLFDAALGRLLGAADDLCTVASACGPCLVVDRDGAVYPCDFYVASDRRLGSVLTEDFDAVLGSPAYRAFAAAKADLPAACLACPHLDLCGGDCPRNRRGPGRPADGVSWLCAGWRHFFSARRGTLAALAGSAAAGGRRGEDMS
jgi:uncharacterized protein